MADWLQTSMQEMQKAMDLQWRNIPRRPNFGLRTKNVYPSNGRRDLKPDAGSPEIRVSPSRNSRYKAPTQHTDICRVRRFIRSNRLCPRTLPGRVRSFGPLRAAGEHQPH